MSRTLNLTVHPGSNGPSLIASKTPPASGSSVTRTLDEYRTFRLYMLHLFRVITDSSSSGLLFGTPVRINDTLKEVLYFLYADIALLVAYLKTMMDPEEFENQSKEVFKEALLLSVIGTKELDDRNAPALDYYNAMIEAQKIEARVLCSTLETTVTEESVDQFRMKLKDYVRNHPNHNPYILHRLYEICENLRGTTWDQTCLFQQRAIGLAQALSPARWLQHYAQGIRYRADGNRPVVRPARSFAYREVDVTVDIRSLIPGRLGVERPMSIFGGRVHESTIGHTESAATFGNFCRAKTASFQNLLRGQCERELTKPAA